MFSITVMEDCLKDEEIFELEVVLVVCTKLALEGFLESVCLYGDNQCDNSVLIIETSPIS